MAGTVTASIVKNDTTSPPQFQNSAGTEVGQLCRAWTKFAGATGTISASFNVSSVTRNGTGDYTVNFTSSFADANYSVAASYLNVGTNPNYVPHPVSQSTASVQIQMNGAAGSTFDPTAVYVAAFR